MVTPARDAAPPVTRLLRAWEGGDDAAREAVLAALYGELRARAAALLRRERGGHTLQPTALVHELFLRLAITPGSWTDGAHFLAAASLAMRRILIDHARRRLASRRRAPSADTMAMPGDGPDRHAMVVAALDDALQALQEVDPRQARVVELRYFGGLSIEETAAALDVSPATVKREWTLARAWLFRRMSG